MVISGSTTPNYMIAISELEMHREICTEKGLNVMKAVIGAYYVTVVTWADTLTYTKYPVVFIA